VIGGGVVAGGHGGGGCGVVGNGGKGRSNVKVVWFVITVVAGVWRSVFAVMT